MKFKISGHAKIETERRLIPLALVESVLANPQQIVPETKGTKAYQSRCNFGGRIFPLRVIVDDAAEVPRVITVYRTSKITKYWRDA